MPDYRRTWNPGGTWFFTVNLLQRKHNDLLVRHVDTLRRIVQSVRHRHPFIVHAWVVLPGHLHCVIELPPTDSNYPMRWGLIKAGFSRSLPVNERRSSVRLARGERGIWQRRYWEHLIRDESDFNAHVDYVHINPLKHGLVGRVIDWPYSTFHRCGTRGVYASDWGGGNGEVETNVVWIM
ncbi:MAG: transposase [Gammaproteobacteria bacterium]|nr:transposase [Gammaproteobacteria bacterium]